MKPSLSRRYRLKTSPSREGGMFRKESQTENAFFGPSSASAFFQPTATVQRKCNGCKEDDKKIHRMPGVKDEDRKIHKQEVPEQEKAQKQETVSTSAKNYISNLDGKGTPLPSQTAKFFSNRMRSDFSKVKIHTGKDAEESARELNARAYTTGSNIVFNQGQYNPDSGTGRKLLAHELAHVVQQKKETVSRKDSQDNISMPVLPPVQISGEGSETANTTHYANCEDISVSGSTTANYRNSFSASGTPGRSEDCDSCTGNDCISVSGNVSSVFTTRPQVSLPAVPSGLNACERKAVRNFINTTLAAHEQDHVAAFNTYRGTVVTPYSFTGCRSELQSYVQDIHDSIEVPRRAASDAASDALDANGANNFPITCDCPDPEPKN